MGGAFRKSVVLTRQKLGGGTQMSRLDYSSEIVYIIQPIVGNSLHLILFYFEFEFDCGREL